MNNFKKVVALGLAATMVLGSSVTVLADPEVTTGTVTGTAGTAALEGSVDLTVYSLALPTAAAIKAVVDYTVDVHGLVKDTDAARYNSEKLAKDKIDDSTGVLFQNKSEDGTKTVSVSGQSDPITFYNKSSAPVDVTVTATLGTPDTKIKLGSNTTWSSTNNMYIGLVNSTKPEKALAAGANSFTAVADSDAAAYTKAYASNAYTYTRGTDETVVGKGQAYSMYVTAAVDKDALAVWDDEELGDLPTITLKFDTAMISDAEAYAVWDGTDLWVGKDADTGFTEDKTVAAVKADGKLLGNSGTITATKTSKTEGEEGWFTIKWSEITTAYGYNDTDSDKTNDTPDDFNVSYVTFTVDGTAYYAKIAQ